MLVEPHYNEGLPLPIDCSLVREATPTWAPPQRGRRRRKHQRRKRKRKHQRRKHQWRSQQHPPAPLCRGGLLQLPSSPSSPSSHQSQNGFFSHLRRSPRSPRSESASYKASYNQDFEACGKPS